VKKLLPLCLDVSTSLLHLQPLSEKRSLKRPAVGEWWSEREAGQVKVFFTVLVGEEERVLHLPPLPQNTPVRLNAEALND
jgi:hypothetical protein